MVTRDSSTSNDCGIGSGIVGGEFALTGGSGPRGSIGSRQTRSRSQPSVRQPQRPRLRRWHRFRLTSYALPLVFLSSFQERNARPRSSGRQAGTLAVPPDAGNELPRLLEGCSQLVAKVKRLFDGRPAGGNQLAWPTPARFRRSTEALILGPTWRQPVLHLPSKSWPIYVSDLPQASTQEPVQQRWSLGHSSTRCERHRAPA